MKKEHVIFSLFSLSIIASVWFSSANETIKILEKNIYYIPIFLILTLISKIFYNTKINNHWKKLGKDSVGNFTLYLLPITIYIAGIIFHINHPVFLTDTFWILFTGNIYQMWRISFLNYLYKEPDNSRELLI